MKRINYFTFLFSLFIFLSNGAISQTELNYEQELIGNWNFLEMRNPRGEKIEYYQTRVGKVSATGPDIILLADGTYKKIFFGNEDTGKWYFNRDDMQIEYDLYIEGTGFADKDLIKRGLAVKHEDGNYYERVTDKIISLKEGEMILDERGMQQIFRKEN